MQRVDRHQRHRSRSCCKSFALLYESGDVKDLHDSCGADPDLMLARDLRGLIGLLGLPCETTEIEMIVTHLLTFGRRAAGDFW